jgi:hypothetical protein
MDRCSSQSLMSILSHKIADTCKCTCSINGCTAVVLFWKASYRCRTGFVGSVSELLGTNADAERKSSKLPRMHRRELENEVRRIEEAFTAPTHNWIAIQFIRFLVFSLLGIRHTCCNLAFIPNEADFRKMPCPRYSQEDIQRIQREDQSLRGLLEVNIKILEAAYSTHKGGLQGFIDECLLPRMSSVLGKIAERCHAGS